MPSRAVVALAPLFLLLIVEATAAPGADPVQDPIQELARLAQAVRKQPTPQNYKRLARYLETQAGTELGRQGEFVLALADLEQARPADAQERLEKARASEWVGEYATFHLARLLAERGVAELALGTLASSSFAGTGLDVPARALRAEILVRAGRAREAVGWLADQPDLADTPGLLLPLATAQRAARQRVEAVDTLQRVYFEFPLSPEAELANRQLSELSAELGPNYPPPSELRRRTRAEKLWMQGAYGGARSAYVDLSVRSSEPTRAEARVRAAQALYESGSIEAACEELARIPAGEDLLAAEVRSYRVRCDLRNGQPARVDTGLAYLAAHFPETRSYQEALLAAAATAERENDRERARTLYRRLREAFPAGSASAEPHWRLAWLSYQEGEKAEAARLMEEHLSRFPDSPFLPRVLFWRARYALDSSEESLAASLFGFLGERSPRAYVTQQTESLWKRRMGSPATNDSWLPPWAEVLGRSRPTSSPGRLPPPVRRRVERVEVLERLGLYELAGKELEAALGVSSHPDLYLVQARLAFAEDKFALASEVLRRAHPDYWNYSLESLPADIWGILFPLPRAYWELIEREARRQRVDPFLVAALIRQESRFERQAVSSAGALGLMQLMPATARHLAGVRRLGESRILEPELNIRLGTRFLAQLLERFQGSWEKAVAGYNAGGTRVEQWVSAYPSADPAAFVEGIPVTQTREFVHTVLRNYRFYRDLYGEAGHVGLAVVHDTEADDTAK